MPAPSADYYRKLPERIGSVLTPQQVSWLLEGVWAVVMSDVWCLMDATAEV